MYRKAYFITLNKLLIYDCILSHIRSKLHFSEPRVHAMVYEPTTGELTKLPVDFNDYFKVLRQVYDLYSLDESPNITDQSMGLLAQITAPTSNPIAAAAAVQSQAPLVEAKNADTFTNYPVENDLNDEEEVALQKLIDSYPLHANPFNPLEKKNIPYNPDDY